MSDNAFNRRNLIRAISGAGIGSAVFGSNRARAATRRRSWDMETDVAVLGYGGAGAAAAIAAHDAGAKVLLIEKQEENNHFPNSRMAAGTFHSPAKDADRQALKQYAIAMMSGDNVAGKLEGEEPDVIDGLAQAWADDAPNTLDYLHSLDAAFNPMRAGGPVFPKFPGAAQSKYISYLSSYTGKVDMQIATKNKPKSEKMLGEAYFACLSNGVLTRKIPVLYGAAAKELIMEGKEVIGAIVDQHGRQLDVKARRAVVITTGGYEYSTAMRRAFLEGPGVKGWSFWGTPANTGDGIAMAMNAGAALAKVSSVAGGLSPTVPLPGSPTTKIAVGQTGSTPHSMIVNQYGDRYVDESKITREPNHYYFYHKAAEFDIDTLLWPNAPSWMIFDETYRRTTTIAFMGFGAVGTGYVPWTPDNMDAINRGWILKADTIEELARRIKAQPDNVKLMNAATLTKTVGRFNEFCKNGRDADYDRAPQMLGAILTAPYYAILMSVSASHTMGGIAANAKREVLDWNDRPVRRLYTAGEISSAFKFIYVSGGNLTENIIFGRIAGRNAAMQKPWD